MMHKRPYNFSAGPAALPESVLQTAAAEMLDWQGSGMSVMEMSHRGKEFGQIHEAALANLRTLLAVPEHFKILFLQGGGLSENAIVPMNLSQGGVVDVVRTGSWSEKSAQEARKYATVNVVATNAGQVDLAVPDARTWQITPNASYLHICSNETIHGVEFADWPDLAALGVDTAKTPLVVDCSSHILSRPMDWSRIGVAFAGAQKNIGPAGLTIVIVREDLLDRALPICPSAFHFKTVAEHNSLYNTPPTYAIYIAGLVFQHVLAQGGVPAMQQLARARAEHLYGAIDASSLYMNPVAKANRSRMNVPFFLRGDDGQPLLAADHPRNVAFLAGAQARGLLQLKGHKSVGGMRASIYNAMRLEGVQALIDYMQDFAKSI